MNLRKVGNYNIGLDIGTASVGWCVTDENGNLCHFNNYPTWGSRLFPEAQKAADARVHRGQRRRYNRRRQRLNLLQKFFESEMNQLDPEFFIRLNQSRLHPEDRPAEHANYHWPIFNASDFNEADYYAKFPTIYHLRRWLISTDEKADLRLIYLAFHNIVKHRGNFLQQDNPNLSSKNASIDDAVENLCIALEEWCLDHGISCAASNNSKDISKLMHNTNARKTDLAKDIQSLFAIRAGEECGIDGKQAKALETALAKAVVGLKTDMALIFFLFEDQPEGLTTNIYLSNDEQVMAVEESCPEDGAVLFQSLKSLYSAYVLQEILRFKPSESISANKVAEYEEYKDDLRTLKSLVKQYTGNSYDDFFRGPLYPNKKYDTSKAQGYTKYNSVHKTSYDDFKKDVKKLFDASGAENDPRYIQMMERFDNERFLRRLKTSDNGAIPFQLHLEEMDDIIENQKQYYPFLAEHKDKLEKLVSFRIPYYVGPLTTKNARRVNDTQDGEFRFAWAERKPGKENDKIYPWNWEEIIDKNKSAENFIRRMTGTCTYLYGEPVLPRNSLLYEEFCVLNELNGAHFTQDGDKERRFDYKDRVDMIEELFKRGSVSYKKVSDWMSQRGHHHVHVSGGQGEKGFESKLTSYIFFCKDVFNVEELPISDYPMIEKIILWNTLFEDRDILKEKLKGEFGDILSDQQIKTICRKRFTGWGKLSERFLTGITAETDDGQKTIMDVLREGNPQPGKGYHPMVLMELLRDDKLRFEELADEINKAKFGEGVELALEDLPGSPALRRGINQALKIVDEICSIAGHEPSNIFVEVTRSDDDRRKGSRTKRRYDALKEQLESFKRDNFGFYESKLKDEINSTDPSKLDEKITLYFMQGGKSLYSGESLHIDRLSEYEVDHILPQSYIKDDSFENKALVLKKENQNKSDQMLLPQEVRSKMRGYWAALKSAGLIGEKKFRNLMRSKIEDKQLKGFINRQIVETSQIVKIVQQMLDARLSNTNVQPIKAGLSAQLRDVAGFVKCREINDFHHAHDALLACQIGRFIQLRFPYMFENPLKYQHVIRSFIKQENSKLKSGRTPFSSTFVISSFMSPGFDEETGEIIRDVWNSGMELDRIRKYLNYRQCHITRMPEETSGAFWNATIYSPHDPSMGSKLKLPLKKDLDPKKYGGYSSEQFAYFFIYEVEKNNKQTLEFAPVPISVAASMKGRSDALEQYAITLANEAGVEFRRIVREKILKYQLIEVDGSRLYITGVQEVRNGVQIALNQNETGVIMAIMNEHDNCMPGIMVTNEELDQLFNRIKYSLIKYSPRVASSLKIDEWNGVFYEADPADKGAVLLRVLSLASAKTNMIDLLAVGRSKNSGCLRITFSKVLSDDDVFLIDQSITGMFERRERIGL